MGVCALLIAASVLSAKWAFGHAVAVNATELEVATLGAELAPDDPHARFGLGQLLEKTLMPGDDEKALAEFEAAVDLSPRHYEFWLALARARERSGDAGGAEAAVRKAQELAPNYSRVRWALGNVLLRQGRQEEAFEEIRRAAQDGSFANPAAAAAWQIFEGDVDEIRRAVGDSPRINASIAVLLAGDKRYREALDFWRRLPDVSQQNELKETGQALYNKLIEGGRYRSAVEVGNDIGLFPNQEVVVGGISNGDFESALTPANANIFSWSIGAGAFPSIGLNPDQKRGGNYSLLMRFGQGGNGFRQISQKIAVEPLQAYHLQFFYRADLTTAGRIRCDVSTMAGVPLAGTVLNSKQEWAEAATTFSVPADVEGIELRITIEGCPAGGCTVAGNIWFDDFSLTRR